jgi:hypothetical protein
MIPSPPINALAVETVAAPDGAVGEAPCATALPASPLTAIDAVD